jgi:hypothetical protein
MPDRYWIRNDVGRIWGPFTLDSVGRVNVGKDVTRVMVSTDGKAFRPVSEFPQVQDVLEKGSRPAAPVVQRRDPPSIAPRAVPTDRVYSADSIPPPPPPVEPVFVGVPKEGSLAVYSVARLYAQIAGAQLLGKLTISAPEGDFAIFFKKGSPERVDVPKPAEMLGRFLIQRAVAPAAEIDNAVEISGGPDGDLVDALFALGVVPQHLLFPLLGEHGTDMLNRVLQLEHGGFIWEEGVAPPPGSFALGQKWDLLCRWVRKVPRLIVRERLGDKTGRAAYRSSGSFATLEALRLTAQEARIAASFDGTHSPEQIAFEHVAEPEVVYRTTLLLSEVGYLAFGPLMRRPTESSEIDAPILEKVSANDQSVAGSDGDVATVGKVGLRPVAVKVAAGEAHPKPVFIPPVLVSPINRTPPPAARPGTSSTSVKPVAAAQTIPPKPPVTARPPPPSTTPPAAKTTTSSATVRPVAPAAKPAPPKPVVAPSKAPPVVKPVTKPEKKVPVEDLASLQALLETWKKANHFEVLGIAQTAGAADIKAAYLGRARQYHPDTVTDPAQTDIRSIKADLVARVNEAYQLLSDTQERTKYIAELQQGGQVDIGPILQAEEDFLRATILVKARKFPEAMDLLDRAIHMNPNEAEFLAWRAWALFSAAKDKRALYEESLATCARVIKEMPQCAAAHLFIGQMAKIMGDPARAEKAFRAVVEIDPNNIDAKRELRGKL